MQLLYSKRENRRIMTTGEGLLQLRDRSDRRRTKNPSLYYHQYTRCIEKEVHLRQQLEETRLLWLEERQYRLDQKKQLRSAFCQTSDAKNELTSNKIEENRVESNIDARSQRRKNHKKFKDGIEINENIPQLGMLTKDELSYYLYYLEKHQLNKLPFPPIENLNTNKKSVNCRLPIVSSIAVPYFKANFQPSKPFPPSNENTRGFNDPKGKDEIPIVGGQYEWYSELLSKKSYLNGTSKGKELYIEKDNLIRDLFFWNDESGWIYESVKRKGGYCEKRVLAALDQTTAKNKKILNL